MAGKPWATAICRLPAAPRSQQRAGHCLGCFPCPVTSHATLPSPRVRAERGLPCVASPQAQGQLWQGWIQRKAQSGAGYVVLSDSCTHTLHTWKHIHGLCVCTHTRMHMSTHASHAHNTCTCITQTSHAHN
ncbi:unnamed protein product, partial [Gulo gulo]